MVIVRGSGIDYLQRHPHAAEVGIVVEVSDATLSRDRNLKKRLYAAANIPVYWIVNLQDNQIEVYTHPEATATTPDYGQRQTYYLGEAMPVWLEDERLGDMLVASLLPA